MSANFIRAFLKKIEPISCSNPSYSSSNYDLPSFKHLLNSCSSLSNLKQIHALIFTNGAHQNLLLSTKLITSACAFSHTMEYARKLFDAMPRRDVFLWNSMMRGYAALGPCHESIVMYRTMLRSGLGPDNYTFPFVVRSCAVISAFREGKEMHCSIVKYGFDLDVFVQSTLISLYSQSGDIFNMGMIFREILVKNIVSWTAMIAGYVQNGFFQKGLNVFKEMVNDTRPNVITLVSVLPACADVENFNLGKLIHSYGFKSGYGSDISLMNALIALYGKCGNLEISKSIFDGMKVRNLVSWNTMIAAYEQNNGARKAIKLFRRMETEKIDFDYITMVSVISACAGLGALNDGKWVHNIVRKKGFELNNSVTNALIDMYAKCGNINLAREAFDKLPNKSIVTWTAMISACAAHGHGLDALDLFDKMIKEGRTKPNSFTFTAVLSACRHSGLVDEGRCHFESMTRKYAIVPSVEHCACMVDLLGRAGCLNEAYEFIKKMMIKPDVGVYGALLAACRIHGNIELAEIVAEKIFILDSKNVTFYVLMSHIYAEAGRWEDAEKLKHMIDERKLEKTAGYSSVEINRRFHTFLSGSRSQIS